MKKDTNQDKQNHPFIDHRVGHIINISGAQSFITKKDKNTGTEYTFVKKKLVVAGKPHDVYVPDFYNESGKSKMYFYPSKNATEDVVLIKGYKYFDDDHGKVKEPELKDA